MKTLQEARDEAYQRLLHGTMTEAEYCIRMEIYAEKYCAYSDCEELATCVDSDGVVATCEEHATR